MSGANVERSANYMNTQANKAASVVAGASVSCSDVAIPYKNAHVRADVHYQVEYYNPSRELQWIDEFSGLVVTAGLNKLLDATFKTGLASPAWYVGLVDGAGTPVIVAADTMASHAGWSENTAYTEAVRQTWTPGTIASAAVSNAASQAIFSCNADGTIYGVFLTDTDAISPGNTGTLYDVGQFTEGSHLVYNGGALHVTVRLTLAAA